MIVNNKNLLNTLEKVKPFIKKENMVTDHSIVDLNIKGNDIEILFTSDSSYGKVLCVDCIKEGQGSFSLDFFDLYKSVKAIVDDFKLTINNNTAIFKTNEKRIKLPVYQKEIKPDLEYGEGFLHSNMFIESWEESLNFVTNPDDIRVSLTGVNMKLLNDNIVVSASDAHTLYYSYKKIDINTLFDVIIPADVVKNILLVSKSFTIDFVDNHIYFYGTNFVIASPLIKEKYPKVENVIPKENSYKCDIDLQKFINATDYLSKMTKHKISVFDFKDKSIYIEETDLNKKVEHKIDLSCDYEGRVGFNIDYILRLKKVSRLENKFYFSTETRPFVFKGENKLVILMPVSIN